MYKNFRWSLLLIVILSLGLIMVGCGSSKGTTSEGGKKKYIVGTDADYAPNEYINEKGEIVGFEIDFVKALAAEMGFEVEFVDTGWEPLFPAVNNGDVDFAVSSITITEDRKEEFDFTEPYFKANQLILVPEDSDIQKFEDLLGKKVSVQMSTTGHFVVQELLGETSKDILGFQSMPIAIAEMLNGAVDASVGDNAVINEYIKNNPNVKMKAINDDAFEVEYYGLMVKKGNTELLNLLNEGIQKLKANGKLKEIFGQDLD